MGEALAPWLAFYYLYAQLRDRSVCTHIDNMGVMFGYVTGASSMPDMAVLFWSLQYRAATIGCRLWWEYVASSSNCADEGSRFGPFTSFYNELNALAAEVNFPSWPFEWKDLSKQQWDEYWPR